MSTKKYREENKNDINKRKREWYKNNANKVKNEVTIRKKELRQWFNDYKSTKCCSECGENCIVCLDFHHIDPTDKEMDPTMMIHRGWSRERIMNEISKCIVLCANCHRKLHYNPNNN